MGITVEDLCILCLCAPFFFMQYLWPKCGGGPEDFFEGPGHCDLCGIHVSKLQTSFSNICVRSTTISLVLLILVVAHCEEALY